MWKDVTVIFTDHKPLTYCIFYNSNTYFPRQVRHLDYISQFTSDIRQISDPDNPVADALSRPDIHAIHQLPDGIDFVSMATVQQNDSELMQLQSSTTTSLKFTEFPLDGSDVKLVCDW